MPLLSAESDDFQQDFVRSYRQAFKLLFPEFPDPDRLSLEEMREYVQGTAHSLDEDDLGEP
jgi:hypothetical protein